MEQLGGRPTPAIGFGTGLERIILNLKRQELDVGSGRRPDAFIAVADEAAAGKAMQLAHELRLAGLNAVLGSPGRSLKGQMRLASSTNARFAAIIGAQELTDGSVTLRNLETSEQQKVPLAEAAVRLRS